MPDSALAAVDHMETVRDGKAIRASKQEIDALTAQIEDELM